MNVVSRSVTGVLIIVLGTFLIIFSFSDFIILIYGIPTLLIGLFILFNKKEDVIEKIRRKK